MRRPKESGTGIWSPIHKMAIGRSFERAPPEQASFRDDKEQTKTGKKFATTMAQKQMSFAMALRVQKCFGDPKVRPSKARAPENNARLAIIQNLQI